MKRKQGFRYPAFFVCAHQGGGGAGGAEPTRHPRPDTPDPTPPTRHPRPDTPTPRHAKGGVGAAIRCKRMQRGKSLCKRMQGDASEKARR